MSFSPLLRGLIVTTALANLASGQANRASSSAKPSSGRPAGRESRDAARAELSEADCRAFAESLIQAVEAGDRATFNALMDWDACFERVTAGWDLPAESRREVSTGLRKGVDNPAGFTSQRLREVERGATLRFLRANRRQGRQVALLRMLATAGDEFNYYEFALGRRPGSPVRATDIYVHSTGEFFSETLRGLVLLIVADQLRNPTHRLSPADQDYLRDIQPLKRARDLLAQGQPNEALTILGTLHPETRKRKDVLMTRLRAAEQGGDDKEAAAVRKELRERSQDNPFLAMSLIDLSRAKTDFPGVMKAIDRLDQFVGGDPYLNVTRSIATEAHGDREGARRLARRAIEQDPSLLSAYWALVQFSENAKDHRETLALLKEIDQKFDLEFGDLGQVPDYAGFVKPPQYREWLDYLKNKAPDPDETEDDARPAPKPGGPGTPNADGPTDRRPEPPPTSDRTAPRRPAGLV